MAKSRRGGRKPRSDGFTFIMHWGLVCALVVSLLSGLRIAADDQDSVAGGLARELPGILLSGEVITWHTWAGWTVTFIAVSYAAFLYRSHRLARVTPSSKIRRRIGDAIRAGMRLDIPTWVAINVVLYQVAFVLIGVMAVTGWLLYAGAYAGLGQQTIATIHGVTAFGFIFYLTMHVLAQFKQGMLWSIFRARSSRGAPAAVAIGVASIAVGVTLAVDRTALQTLRVAQAASPPVIDGRGDDPSWRTADAAHIHTVRGANLPGGEAVVEVRSVHDGDRVYFRFRWPDPEPSRLHLPLVKTDQGWRVVQSEFEINDEDEFYEDKFAVAFSTVPELGSGTVHLGQDLIPGPHPPPTRGLHYTNDGSLVDMWHWKSIRTGGMTPAQIDDNFFGPPMPSDKPAARYTGGYGKDPSKSGGYVLNWEVIDSDRPLTEARVVPRFLPKQRSAFYTVALSDEATANVRAHGPYLTRDEVVPYDPKDDDLPIGTVIPSVIIEGPFEGDRGDVLGAGSWADGHWTLEASRPLDTGSEFDVSLAGGNPVYLWVAVFNHTQTRHSQHLRPVELRFE